MTVFSKVQNVNIIPFLEPLNSKNLTIYCVCSNSNLCLILRKRNYFGILLLAKKVFF